MGGAPYLNFELQPSQTSLLGCFFMERTGRYRPEITFAPEQEPPSISSRTPAEITIVAAVTIRINTIESRKYAPFSAC